MFTVVGDGLQEQELRRRRFGQAFVGTLITRSEQFGCCFCVSLVQFERNFWKALRLS